ncbi:MAG: hypothetical protein ING44_03735 [Telmatospirillum sp.]|nr:hypothetical protein [Telmatospirillum sp.]
MTGTDKPTQADWGFLDEHGIAAKDDASQAAIVAAREAAAAAWEAKSPREGAAQATAALAISAYCPSSLVLLSLFLSRDLATREAFLRLALKTHAIAQAADDSDAQRLAGLEAKQHLASVLSVKGERDAAFAQWREVLDADQADPSECRHDFIDALLDGGHTTEASAVADRFPDDTSARLAYARALIAFRVGGAGAEADAARMAAVKANGFVPAYLVGDRKPPKAAPTSIEPASRDEAVVIAVNTVRAWTHTPGALAWIKAAKRGG